ncbi:Lateral flagellin [Duganella sp. FT50W]|uniref:Flagellin n=1 Tax=Duganella lactea TaxID=2692173 RepID=A0A6L8MFP5_9BURK|nr:Lateral flagellin [Duganella lactea]
MLSLQTNSPGLAAVVALTRAGRAQSIAATRLSTGYRVNSAMDDAAGLQIATRLASQMSGTQTAMRNIQNGISLMQVADSVVAGLTTLFSRMRDLAIQAADASTTRDDKLALQSEFTQLYRQAGEVLDTSYAGEHLFVGRLDASGFTPAKFDEPLSFQIGAGGSNAMTVDFNDAKYNMSAGFAYTDPTDLVDLLTDHASEAIDDMTKAVDGLASARSVFGAVGNRLEAAYQNASNLLTNTTAAKGRIVDTDYASESARQVTNQMLMQSSAAMLKQSNGVMQMTLSLLQ